MINKKASRAAIKSLAYHYWPAAPKNQGTTHAGRAALYGCVSTITDKEVHSLVKNAKRCFWCDKEFSGTEKPVADHFIPLSRRGPNIPENVVASCAKCNSVRHTNDPVRWSKKIGRTVDTERLDSVLKVMGIDDDQWDWLNEKENRILHPWIMRLDCIRSHGIVIIGWTGFCFSANLWARRLPKSDAEFIVLGGDQSRRVAALSVDDKEWFEYEERLGLRLLWKMGGVIIDVKGK